MKLPLSFRPRRRASLAQFEWRILVVCMGNICRSPLAEGVLRHRLSEAGLADHVDVDSAGTLGYHAGEAPDPRAQQVAQQAGIDLSTLRARRVCAEDFTRFDWILAMDRHNLAELESRCPEALHGKLRLFLSFAPDALEDEVPDPYYGNLAAFETTLALCETGAAGVIEACRGQLAGTGCT